MDSGIKAPSSLVVWKDASEQAVGDYVRTTSLDWTDLDLSAYVSSNAKFVILQLQHYVSSIAGGKAFLNVRKNGTTPQYVHSLTTDANNGDVATAETFLSVIVALDANKKIQYDIVITGTISINSMINVLGYIE